MRRKLILFWLAGVVCIIMPALLSWIAFSLRGRRFALRDRLHKADAIVVLAGTRGNIKYLDGKIRTAVSLYDQRWGQYIICTGKFSVKVTDTPELIPLEVVQDAVKAGRIQEKDVAGAVKNWDIGLGAAYMREQAIQMGVLPSQVLVENESLHTRENAEYVLEILKKYNMHRIILVTSPFHQLRTYLTFAKVLSPYGIDILNYYADTGEWHQATWFLSKEHRKLVRSEYERIQLYRKKGDLL